MGLNVYPPHALERKYQNAAAGWVWQWAFPAAKLSRGPRSGEARRRHSSEDMLESGVKRAAGAAGVEKRVSCQTLRHGLLPDRVARVTLRNGAPV